MNKTKRKIFETSMKLFAEKGYTRTITALYRVMRRLNIKFYKGRNGVKIDFGHESVEML